MKYPTLQKVMLTSMALVASLALTRAGWQADHVVGETATRLPVLDKASTVRAERMAYLLPFAHTTSSTTEPWKIPSAYGDGSKNFQSLWLNKFDVIAGQTRFKTVSVNWGTPKFPDKRSTEGGDRSAIWSDPNGDGNPSDAVLLEYSRVARFELAGHRHIHRYDIQPGG